MTDKNVFDLQYEQRLNYVFPVDNCGWEKDNNDKVAIFLYLFYEDQIGTYMEYLNNIPCSYDLFLISSKSSVLEMLKRCLNDRHAEYILKENRGRDISALLIECAKYVGAYKYACFLHDKKTHAPELADETELWIKNLWGNLLGSESYIHKIIDLLNNNEKLGVIVPPPPIGDHFAVWQGFGWQGAFDVTKKICKELQLNVNIDVAKPPLAIGTALWFRVDALKKLFAYPWSYKNFNDENLNDLNYLSYGIERVFPFVAQDAGYLTAEVMNTEYASIQNAYLKHSMAYMFENIYEYYPFPTLHKVKLCKKNISTLLSQIDVNKDVYLYGAGRLGRFCLNVLQRYSIKPKAFLVTDGNHEPFIDNLSIYTVDELPKETYKNTIVVITVENRNTQDIIIELLHSKGICNVLVFWEET